MPNYFRKGKSLYTSTTNSFGTGEAVTITPNSVSGLPTDTEMVLTFDRAVAGKIERIKGTITGGNFVVSSGGRGYDDTTEQAHTSPTVEYIPNDEDMNDMVNGVLVEHNQDGTHKSDKVVTLTGTQTLTNKTHNGDLKLAGATDNIQVNNADPYRTIVIPAVALAPTTTAGCATAVTVESTTNKINYKVLDYDTTTEEHAFCNFAMPASWDGGVIQFRVNWTAASGTGGVAFGLAGRSFGDDDAIDQALGTEVEVTDTLIATGDEHLTDWSADVTLAGTPAGGEHIYVELARKPGNAADTLAADARVISLQIRYKIGQYSD